MSIVMGSINPNTCVTARQDQPFRRVSFLSAPARAGRRGYWDQTPGLQKALDLNGQINKRQNKMVRTLFNIAVIIALSGCGSNSTVKPPVNHLKIKNLLVGQTDSIYNQAKYFPDNTQFALALIHDGQVVYYGIQRLNDTLITIENKSKVFEIGSITKVFTTTLLANFVLNKEVDLDSTINKYFDFPFKDNQVFTFRELANHTSGLPRLPSNIRFDAIFSSKNPYKDYDEQKLDEYLQNDISPDYPKGSKSAYSNLGMGLLSYSLRKLSGKSYEQLAREMIFDKYNMVNSGTNKRKIETHLIGGLDDKGRPTPNWEPGALIGAGGIYSTVEDLTKFAFAQFDSANAELALTRVKTYRDNKFRDVGLGWFIINRKNGNKWFWHNGGTGGYSTSMAIDIEHKNGVIILSNISSFHKNFKNIDNLCFSLMKTLY
ncbi:MAG: beta-lactamase family protein [Chitinophagaceae bacterium]|nr:beta-lactamase family protein [Chitinophagaceae bacterium]